MKFRITMLVLLVTLLIGTVGSDAYAYNYNSNVVNKGRSYCPADGEFYTVAGSHKGHVKRSVPALVVQERKSLPQTRHLYTGNNYRSSNEPTTWIENFFALFHIDADVRIYQQRDRLVLVKEYIPGHTRRGNHVIWNKNSHRHRRSHRW